MKRIEVRKKTAYNWGEESMMSVQYVVDQSGDKVGVFISIDEYEHMLELIEDQEDIKAIEEAKKEDDWIPIEEVRKQLGL
jgi:hypothetical protein